MKKIILTVGVCVISLLGTQAQQKSNTGAPKLTADQKADKMLSKLTSTCGLTPDQVTKAKPIIEEAVKINMANKQQYASDKAKLKAANQANRAATNTKLNAILNADQQAKLAAFEQKRQALAQRKSAAAMAKQQQQ